MKYVPTLYREKAGTQQGAGTRPTTTESIQGACLMEQGQEARQGPRFKETFLLNNMGTMSFGYTENKHQLQNSGEHKSVTKEVVALKQQCTDSENNKCTHAYLQVLSSKYMNKVRIAFCRVPHHYYL